MNFGDWGSGRVYASLTGAGKNCRMDMNKTSLMSAISDRMTWLNQRQKLLSENIANADTPNYDARDLKAQDFSQMIAETTGRGFHLMTTNPMHYGGGGRMAGLGGKPTEVKRRPDETSLNKNSVQIEDEMMKVSETQNDYSLMVNLYKKQMGLLRMALGRKS